MFHKKTGNSRFFYGTCKRQNAKVKTHKHKSLAQTQANGVDRATFAMLIEFRFLVFFRLKPALIVNRVFRVQGVSILPFATGRSRKHRTFLATEKTHHL
jgi:hypothetical protein